jgi:ankyrin repeat protein
MKMIATRKSIGALLVISVLSVAGIATAGDLRVANATEQGDKEAVRALLKKHVDVNAPQADGATALAWAVYQDDLEIADLLINAGAKVNAANDYGITPLWLACANGSAAMLDKLLKVGADPNAAQWSGATPLMMCSRRGNAEAVKLLLARGAKVNVAETRQGQTALMWAAAQKRPEVVRVLIQNGANFNARTKDGTTALMFAAQQGDLDSARALLAAGADINAATNEQSTWAGDTALLIASESGQEALSIFLLDKGADPNAADEFGFTALDFALMRGLVQVTGVRLLPFTRTTYLFRPNMVDLVKALLAHGANPNARIKKRWGGNKLLSVRFNDPEKFSVSEVGATPFLLAARTLDVDIMRLLVAAGADPNLSTENRTTPLMMAAGLTRQRDFGSVPLTAEDEKKALEAVKLCVELGADVNAANDLGLTALHGAAFNGSNEIIRFLVQKGAKLDAKDLTGQTPLDKAMVIKPKNGIGTRGNGHDIFIPYIYQKSTVDLLVQLGATPSSATTKATSTVQR